MDIMNTALFLYLSAVFIVIHIYKTTSLFYVLYFYWYNRIYDATIHLQTEMMT